MGNILLNSEMHLRNCGVAGELVRTAKRNLGKLVSGYSGDDLKGRLSSPAPKKIVLAPPLLIGWGMWRVTRGEKVGDTIIISTDEDGSIGRAEIEALAHACATYGSLEKLEILGPTEKMQKTADVARLCTEGYQLSLHHTDWKEYPPLPRIEGLVIADTNPGVHARGLFRGSRNVIVHSPGCTLTPTVTKVIKELVEGGVPAIVFLGNSGSEALKEAVSGNGSGPLSLSANWIRGVVPAVRGGNPSNGIGASLDNFMWTLVRALNRELEGMERPIISGEITQIAKLIKEKCPKIVPMHLDLKSLKIDDI